MMLGREIHLSTALGIPETRESKCECDYVYELEKQLEYMILLINT